MPIAGSSVDTSPGANPDRRERSQCRGGQISFHGGRKPRTDQPARSKHPGCLGPFFVRLLEEKKLPSTWWVHIAESICPSVTS